MPFCTPNCQFGTALTFFIVLVLWTICVVPIELAYLYVIWTCRTDQTGQTIQTDQTVQTSLSCSINAWKYLATGTLCVSTLGLVLFIALTGGLIITVQQKEYKIETLKKLVARRTRHRRRRTRDSVNSRILPSYNFEDTDALSPRSSGPPSYMDIIDENTDSQ